MAYTKSHQRKKEEIERLRGERDQIKFIDLRFERWQVLRFSKARRRQDFSYHAKVWLNAIWDFMLMWDVTVTVIYST